MAIYHLEAKVVSRGAGRSAVAASAYLSCSRLYNDYDGIQHDYTKKQGLVWQEVFLPEYAPQEWENREKLWNAVEEVETAKDSRLAREFVVALPIELSREQQIELLQDFIREQFVADGMCADAAIHDTDGRNPHAHILLTVRPLDEQGHWQYKTEKEYLCMRNGEERGFTAAEFKAAQNERWEKQYPYKVGKKKVYMVPSEADAQGLARADKHPKAPATADRILSPSAGTVRSSLRHGRRYGQMCPTAVWNAPGTRNALTTAAMPHGGWMRFLPSMRVRQRGRWSAGALSLTVAN